MQPRLGHAMLRPVATGNREADKAAIMPVLKAETDAWLRRDLEALARN
jgi:hypothetical protein